MTRACVIVLVLLAASPAAAEINAAAPTAAEQQAANVASWIGVGVAVALDVKASWACPDRLRCFAWQGVRTGVTYGAVFAVKRLVHRARPCAPADCGVDDPDTSFWSAHTAEAFASTGGCGHGPRLVVVLPFAIVTGVGRVRARKHYISDAAVGALAGWATSKLCGS